MSRTILFRGLSAAFAFSGLAPSAHAVMLDPRGLGQVLVFPYYTVNAGQDTLLTVVNTSGVSKAVKVAFREGYNGREALAFTLFLAPHDAWTGAVSATDGNPAGGARLVSSDHSCVTTIWPAAFSTAAFAGSTSDGGPATVDRTREGLLEVIALGDVAVGSATATAITPVQTGQPDAGTPPCNLPGNIAADLVAPTGGLFGSGAIANVGEGTFYAYTADALVGFTSQPLLAPSSRASDADLSEAHSTDSRYATGAIATGFDANGEALQVDYERGIDAVSAVFMADALHNDFLVADALGANTDWIITFPTKQFYVDKQRHPSSVTSPFAVPFGEAVTGKSQLELDPTAAFDAEGGSAWPPQAANCNPSLCPHPRAILSYQVSVLAFLPPERAATSGVFASKLAASPLMLPDSSSSSDAYWMRATSGSMTLDSGFGDAGSHVLTGGKTTDGTGIALVGLPVTGFMAYNVINTNAAPGRLANYGGTFRHRTHWSCAGDVAACE